MPDLHLLLAFMLGAVLVELLQFLGRYLQRPRLNLKVEGNMAQLQIGQTVVARIAPTAADGTAAPVTGVAFSADPDGVYTVVVNADGSATYTAAAVGAGVLARVQAVSAGGVTLRDMQPLPDVVAVQPPPVPEAVALNLTISAS